MAAADTLKCINSVCMHKYATSAAKPARTLAGIARDVRCRSVRMVHRAKLGHIGGDLSAADILVALYFGALRVDARNPEAAERDRFIMSKGHCSAALYSTLALRGFFPEAELAEFMEPLSRLNGHPNRTELPEPGR